MAEIKILERPRMSPMTCIVTGDGRGPVVDLGRDIRGYGRVYVKVSALRYLLEQHGWLSPEHAEELRAELVEQREVAKKTLERADAYDDLTLRLFEAAQDHIPQPEPEVRVETREVTRDPTDEEITAYLARNPNHPAITRPATPGSSEEYHRLYGDPYSNRRKKHREQIAEKRAELADVETSADPDISQDHGQPDDAVTVELHGQKVNLDDLLAGTVREVIDYCEGQPDWFLDEVADHELTLAAKAGRNPRKGLIEGLGFELTGEDDDDE